MSNGRTPSWSNISYFNRYHSRRPIYITSAELFQWAYEKTTSTQEGDPYHDSLTKFQNAMKAIASLFDGSLGTFIDPMSGATVDYPEICDWNDILDMYCDDYANRLVAIPLFDPAYTYTKDNDANWYQCLLSFCGRINRYVKFQTPAYKKFLKTAVVSYNPLADYWKKSIEKGGNAPYAGIVDGTFTTDGQPDINSWQSSNNGDTKYKVEFESSSHNEVNNYVTTYDSDSSTRLANRTVSDSPIATNRSNTETSAPNTAYFRRFSEEGNTGGSPQEALEKEIELSKVLEDLVHKFCEAVNKEIFLSVYTKG